MAGDTVLVDPGNDDPATTPGGPAPHQAHDGARRLRRRSDVSAREEAAPLLLVAIGRVGSKTTSAESPRFLGAAPLAGSHRKPSIVYEFSSNGESTWRWL